MTVTSVDKIKVAKKATKGKTYTIKAQVYAKASSSYNASKTKTVSVKVKVK